MTGEAFLTLSLVLKRMVDVAISFLLLVVFLPLLAVVAVAIRVQMGRPLLFRQARTGRDGRPFEILKLRTMTPAEEGEPWFRDGYGRITRLGHALRRYSIDELPELINVLRGDMSLVGPRPLLVEYLPKYTSEESRRHQMRPGITGLAQVSGGQRLLFSRKLGLDVWYVDNWSPWLDIKIVIRTVRAVLGSAGEVVDLDLDDIDDIGLAPDRERREVPDDP